MSSTSGPAYLSRQLGLGEPASPCLPFHHLDLFHSPAPFTVRSLTVACEIGKGACEWRWKG